MKIFMLKQTRMIWYYKVEIYHVKKKPEIESER